MPSSEGSSLTTVKEAFTTSAPKQNQSISTQGNVSSHEEPHRKRRNADTTQETPARHEVKTLPLYKTKRNESISLYKYSGNVSRCTTGFFFFNLKIIFKCWVGY